MSTRLLLLLFNCSLSFLDLLYLLLLRLSAKTGHFIRAGSLNGWLASGRADRPLAKLIQVRLG